MSNRQKFTDHLIPMITKYERMSSIKKEEEETCVSRQDIVNHTKYINRFISSFG